MRRNIKNRLSHLRRRCREEFVWGGYQDYGDGERLEENDPLFSIRLDMFIKDKLRRRNRKSKRFSDYIFKYKRLNFSKKLLSQPLPAWISASVEKLKGSVILDKYAKML